MFIQYNITVVATQFQNLSITGRAPTQAELVTMANAYATAYSGVPNPNDCHWINIDTGAAAGATLRDRSYSLNPIENLDGGFWRVVHRGSDNPVANWFDLTQPGDIVRFDWSDPSAAQHTTMVVGSVGLNGRVNVVDNGGGSIGLHSANYDDNSVASSVTIYRLTTDNLYVSETTDQSETYAGSLYNDDIRSKGGNDTVRSGAGNDRVNPGAGNDTVDGGDGRDTAIFAGDRGEYDIRTTLVAGLLQTRVVHLGGTASDGADMLSNIEVLAFPDRTFGFAGAQLNHVSNVDGTRFDDVLFQNATTGQVLLRQMWDGAFNGWGAATGVLGADWKAVAAGDVNPGADRRRRDLRAEAVDRHDLLRQPRHRRDHLGRGVDQPDAPTGSCAPSATSTATPASTPSCRTGLTGTIYYADMRGGAFPGWDVVNTNLTTDWVAVGAGDINRDGFADVVVQQQSTGTTYYANMADGAFAGWGVVSTNLTADWKVKAVADVTGDGFADVVFQQRLDRHGLLRRHAERRASTTGAWCAQHRRRPGWCKASPTSTTTASPTCCSRTPPTAPPTTPRSTAAEPTCRPGAW